MCTCDHDLYFPTMCIGNDSFGDVDCVQNRKLNFYVGSFSCDILTYLLTNIVIYAGRIGFNPSRLKVPKRE